MYELTWDCNIEEVAYAYSCDRTAVNPAYGVVEADISLGGSPCNITAKTHTLLQKWWDEAKTTDLSQNVQYVDAIKNFGIMANAKAKGFACTYNKCPNGAKFVCVYDQKLVVNNPQNSVYTVAGNDGEACDSCAQDQATCVGYLCTKTYDSTATLPATKCTQPNDDGMTLDLQTTAQDMLNYYRRALATGWGTDKNGYAPPAKQINKLTYDCDTLGSHAKLVMNCNVPVYTPLPGNSLSYYKVDNPFASHKDVLTEAITSWWKQLEKVDVDKEAKFTNELKTNAPDFANMAIATATKVGCSVLTCLKQGYVVAGCEFDKALNVDDPIYTVGTTCTSCRTANLQSYGWNLYHKHDSRSRCSDPLHFWTVGEGIRIT
ncbi:hypothetical protein RB195_005568 [Necator americanus]|uniref:SCP domain-containing protein n=1 Tax=Necator americanus TaxID=51031 RepID=A0ABR1BRP7_NECAM